MNSGSLITALIVSVSFNVACSSISTKEKQAQITPEYCQMNVIGECLELSDDPIDYFHVRVLKVKDRSIASLRSNANQ